MLEKFGILRRIPSVANACKRKFNNATIGLRKGLSDLTEVSLPFSDILQKTIAAHYPDYRLPKNSDFISEGSEFGILGYSHPHHCEGDFFGDGGINIALFIIGKAGTACKVIVLRKLCDNSPHIMEITGGSEKPIDLYLEVVPPGYYRTWEQKIGDVSKGGRRRPLHLKRDGIMLGLFESGASIFYYDVRSCKFKSIWFSD
jgi:hypothetical protein